MENSTSTNKNLCYSFIAVPTNLFFSLDNNLRNALTVLLQLSSVFADQEGYFFRTNEDLQADFKMGKNLTIAVLESLYQYGLLSVKSVGFTKKKGKKQVNFFRVNTEVFKDYEKYHIYTITKNEELHLNTVDYKAKDFKVTYTADTENSSADVETKVTEEIPTEVVENVSEASETANTDSVETDTLTDEEMDTLEDTVLFSDEEECPLTDDELKEFNIRKLPTAIKEVESDAFRPGAEGKVIETASVVPTDLGKVETRSFSTNVNSEGVNEEIIGKCYGLANRYCKMEIPNSEKSLELCNQALDYINDKYQKKYITEADKNRLTKVIIEARFKKHRI